MICIFNIKKILKKSNRIYVNHINLMQDNIKKHEIQNQINILAPTSYLLNIYIYALNTCTK